MVIRLQPRMDMSIPRPVTYLRPLPRLTLPSHRSTRPPPFPSFTPKGHHMESLHLYHARASHTTHSAPHFRCCTMVDGKDSRQIQPSSPAVKCSRQGNPYPKPSTAKSKETLTGLTYTVRRHTWYFSLEKQKSKDTPAVRSTFAS